VSRQATGTAGAAGSGTDAAGAGKIHVVRKGEALPALARKYYGNAKKTAPIVKANPDVDFRKSLAAGTRLVIPEAPQAGAAPTTLASAGKKPDAGKSGPATLSSTTANPAEPAAAPPAAKPAGRTHVVQPGETLWSIADHYLGSGPRFTEIVEANPGMTRDSALKAGQKIAIPDAKK
jgi:nucleoid-associated protein YgaU